MHYLRLQHDWQDIEQDFLRSDQISNRHLLQRNDATQKRQSALSTAEAALEFER